MKNCKLFYFAAIAFTILLTSCDKDDSTVTRIATFDDLTIATGGYWNGSDGSGFFQTTDLKFDNIYTAAYGSWSGFAYSNEHDATTAGYNNQYSVFDSSNGNNKFALFYLPYSGDAFATFAEGKACTIESISLCNSTYVGLSMKNGDAYSKKFGGTTGNDPDWFKVTIDGYNTAGTKVGSVEFYLADYRATDNSKDYIVGKWTKVDLKSLGKVNKISFNFESTDTGDWGMNTPAYVCLDNIRYSFDETDL